MLSRKEKTWRQFIVYMNQIKNARTRPSVARVELRYCAHILG